MAVLANFAIAAEVTLDEASAAASAFVTRDAIGSSVLGGREVSGVVRRGRLWVAALSPSGHIVLSGSDFADPIVGFSKNDFVEPDPESPAFAVLAGADASVAALEAQGGTRHARWTRLVGGGVRGFSVMADDPSSDAVFVQPFLDEHFNQWQPYNDFAPVYEPNARKVEAYRGRCPCGCVATAAAQVFHHFRWPARIDDEITCGHMFTNTNDVDKYFSIRFDGHVPIDWNAISNSYSYYFFKPVTNYYPGGHSVWYKTDYDLRGAVAESVRYPIARLILLCDVMANMHFKSGGSSANYDTVADNVSEWYTQGQWIEVCTGADYSQIVYDLQAGIPLQVSLDGHQVVAHGWADDGTSKYIYLNYGWGGSNDGYYNMDNSTIDLAMQEIYVGHYPRAKPQIEPLPKVSDTGLTLNWHFPDFYTNNLSGFTVSVSKTATTTSTFLDNFSSTVGSSSSSDIYVTPFGSENLLYSDYAASGVYSYPQSFTLTSASVLTFKVASYAAISSTLEVQARFDGGSWQTISTPDLDDEFGTANWSVQRVYLGDHGGETAQFRIVRSWGGYYYLDDNGEREDSGYVNLDDFKVTEILDAHSPENLSVANTARSCTFTGLDAGSTCTFTVTPVMSGALVQGEASEPVATSIAGERRTPLSGEQTYSSSTLTFSTADTSGVWSYNGTRRSSNTLIRDKKKNSITANLPGELATGSTLSFTWKSDNYYESGSAYDTFSVVFNCDDGTVYTLWTTNVAKKISQTKSILLTDYAGKKGKIVISYSHTGANYTSDSYGGTLSNAKVTKVMTPSVPAAAWSTETLVARGMPEILSVSDVTEGFYGEWETNTTEFIVTCSSTVNSLVARPSHLSLLGPNDVSCQPMGGGRFKVSVRPHRNRINEANFRSRMILTLIAEDLSGTMCYKDLSLRFAPVEVPVTEVVVTASTSGGTAYSVTIPCSWIESSGLVPPESDADAYEAAVATGADADSDGLPNWAEYVCGTSPTNAAENVTVSIAMENGSPVVTYTPADSQIAPGFKAVIKGATDLATPLSTWEVVTETRTSTCKFFRVEIVPEN